ncbi:UNVERIFIED_CONTAM: hypothetical protein Slati_2659700 [Sesamum latifolium]|uniref:Transposase n=1 Tax=Sesamum latifolium TaxID=2727402 RepID=A0AAW2VU31_9LAMI
MVIDATGPIFPPVYVSHQPNKNETGISSNDRGGSFLDVPLIEELVQLWQVGAQTYDASRKEFFMKRAALMWTVNDFPAYEMLSSWSIIGIMGCTICMDNTRAFHLQHSRKTCYFDCHRQFLKAGHPYRRNKKAFMKGRVEKNEAPPRANGGKRKIKDNLNARKDVEIICDQPEIVVSGDRLGSMTKAVYTLNMDQKRKIFEWIKALRFSDGYTSNRCKCVDLNELKLHGMKRHDCHIFIERLIPTAFREMLPEFVWNALTEACYTLNPIDTSKIQSNFNFKVEKWIREAMGRCRRGSKKADWMSNDVWAGLQNAWASEKFQAILQINKTNRQKNIASASTIYQGGSASISKHKRKLEQFQKLNDNHNIASEYLPESSSSAFVNGQQLWLEAIEGVKKEDDSSDNDLPSDQPPVDNCENNDDNQY